MAEVRPHVAELLAYLDETRAKLEATASAISPALASIRPREGMWSAAEVLAHLAKVEAGVATLFERSIQWARSHDIGPATAQESVLSNLDKFGMIESETKLTAPEMVVPDPDIPMGDSLAALEVSRGRLRIALIESADLDLSRVTRPHRVLGEINLYQWALFVAQHEERHRKQIDRTMNEVTGRAAECAPIV